jgi:cell division septal protein FtsQ
MIKSRKKRSNRYQESKTKRLRDNFRKFKTIIGFFAGFCLLILLGAGLSRLYHTLLDVPWLKVEEIEISGIKKLDRFTVLNTIGIKRGECILNLRMGPVAERLKSLPLVKSASVRLDIPGRIVAELAEREPVAALQCGNSRLLMDDQGLLFARATPEGNLTIPIVTGVCGTGLKEGSTVPSRDVGRIQELAAALEKSRNWLSSATVRECQWNANGFTLVLGERGVPVDIGKDQYSGKLAKLRRVIKTLEEKQWTELVTRIDLDYPDKAYLNGQFSIPKPAQGQGKQPS